MVRGAKNVVAVRRPGRPESGRGRQNYVEGFGPKSVAEALRRVPLAIHLKSTVLSCRRPAGGAARVFDNDSREVASRRAGRLVVLETVAAPGMGRGQRFSPARSSRRRAGWASPPVRAPASRRRRRGGRRAQRGRRPPGCSGARAVGEQGSSPPPRDPPCITGRTIIERAWAAGAGRRATAWVVA